MNSKERVKNTFSRGSLDRVARWMGASDEFLAKIMTQLKMSEEEVRQYVKDDFRVSRGRWKEGSSYTGDVTPFTLERGGMGCGYSLSHPLSDIETIKEVEDFEFRSPEEFDPSSIITDSQKYSDYAILSGAWSPFWHDAIDLVGHEDLYYLFYDHPEVVEALFDKLATFYLTINEKILEHAADYVDVIFIGNDFGAQAGPLLGAEQFNQFVAPSLKRFGDQAKRYNKPLMVHSCGSIVDLLPSIIECGVDGLHALQPDSHGMDFKKIKDEFGADLILNGAIDSVNILINLKDTAEVKSRTREVVEYMMKGGGYIASASHDTILEDTPVENIIAMFEVVDEYGIY